MNTNTGGPAFPMSGFDTRHGQPIQAVYQHGMALRDYFAAKAMQGELASQRDGYEWHSYEKLAKHCYNIADAMLEERES